MTLVRQFLKEDCQDPVICQWNEVTGSWRCSSTLDSTHTYRAPNLGPFLRRLKEGGFQEVRPG